MTRRAEVYLVGSGPGDPDLLTVQAVKLLGRADAVLYDRLVSREVLALCRAGARLVDCGKEFGEQEAVQQRIYSLLLEEVARGGVIVRLKSGDPMVFGRGGEELDFLARHGVNAQVAPGVSSALAGPALSGVPLTQRGVASGFAVIAGHRQSVASVDWGAYRGIETLVVLMGVEFRDCIAGSLIRAGRDRDQPVLFIERASTPQERRVESTLARVAAGKVAVDSPAVMLIGEVVRLRHRVLELEEQFA